MQEELARLFSFSDIPNCIDILKLLDVNTRGKVYMLGGGVFRQITSKYWKEKIEYRDFDFVAPEVVEELTLPRGWVAQKNSYGAHKVFTGETTIDLWSHAQQYSIVSRGLPFTIEAVLQLTPLTIQSIAYDLQENSVKGGAGLDAIRSRTVGVNCLDQAKHYCSLKGFSVNEFIQQKAMALGFRPVFI